MMVTGRAKFFVLTASVAILGFLLTGLIMLVLGQFLFQLLSETRDPISPQGGSSERNQAIILEPIDFSGWVTRVVDGDTFWVDSRDVRIRIWGLDAPERADPGGSQATEQLARLITGQPVQCRERAIDRWGRIVGQCFHFDGRDIAAEMISSGTASEFCRYSQNYYGTCH